MNVRTVADLGPDERSALFDRDAGVEAVRDDVADIVDVIDRIVEWNLNDDIGGTSYTRDEIIGFIVDWNQAQA